MASPNDQFESVNESLRNWLRNASLCALVLWCAWPLSPSSVDSDFWGHVQYGRDTLEHGLARTATYTYTSRNYPWINHENLAEVLMAATVDGLGVSWLLVGKCCLGCAVVAGAILRARREGVRLAFVSIVCVIGAMNLSYYWGLRPHVLTFAAFAWLIAWTDRSFAPWCQRYVWNLGSAPQSVPDVAPLDRGLHRLWLVPFVMAIWANTHGGFLAGLAVFLTLLLGRAVPAIVAGGARGRRDAAYLGLIGGISVAATLLNPYGLQLHSWLVYDVFTPRPEIAEWQPIDWTDPSASKIFLLLVIALIGWCASNRPRDVTQTAIGVLVLVQAIAHQRHWPFFVILCLYWLPVPLQAAWDRVVEQREASLWVPSRPWLRAGQLAIVIASLVFTVQLVPRFREIPVRRDDYPVDAVEFMASHGLKGRLVVAGHWAQYALATLGDRTSSRRGIQVAFDGRHRTCYPQELLDLHFDFFLGNAPPTKRYRSPQSPPADATRILTYGQPEWVLIGRHHTHAQRAMQRMANDWTLVYEDAWTQLWGRSTTIEERPQLAASKLPMRAMATFAVRAGSTVAWPAAPREALETLPAATVRERDRRDVP